MIPDAEIMAIKFQGELRAEKRRILIKVAAAALPALLPNYPGDSSGAVRQAFKCADYFIKELAKREIQ